MTQREVSNTVSTLLESLEGYADALTPGLNKTENHIRLLYALQAAMCEELRLLERQVRSERLAEDAAETKMERYREAA